MTAFLKTSYDGYLMVDHRASPGIPAHQAERMGLDPKAVGEGSVYEAPTLGCPHCGSHVILNPQRSRERANCSYCNRYICDGCALAMKDPSYVHHTAMELAELVASGRFELFGSMNRPTLKLKETSSHV